jgi:hypothetical protein
MDYDEDTVTIPLKVYESYKGAAACLIAAKRYGIFELLSEEEQLEVLDIAEEILASGMLK